MDISIPEWLPDQPPFQNPGATVITNVLPGLNSYRQAKALDEFSDALTARCRGAITGVKSDGTIITYAGDATTLNAAAEQVFSDVSISGGYALDGPDRWEGVQFGDKIIMVSITAEVQSITIGGANFANHITSSRTPSAKTVGIVKDTLVLGNVTDSTDGDKPQRVWWSSITDTTDFDPANATLSGIQDLNGDHGDVQKVIGGATGRIFMERAIYTMEFEGVPTKFGFRKVINGIGALAPGGVIHFGRVTYFLAADGFYAFDGTNVSPIGKEKIDRTIIGEIDKSQLHKVSSAVDPENGLVYWLVPTSGTDPNRIYVYNWLTERWARLEVTAEIVFGDRTKPTTLDGASSALIIDDEPQASWVLDDLQFSGNDFALGAFSAGHKLSYFTGSALTATLETADVQPFDGQRTFINLVRPLVEGTSATTTVSVGTRETQGVANSFATAVSTNTLGAAPVRASGRFMRFRLTITGGFDHVQGIQIPDEAMRSAGAR